MLQDRFKTVFWLWLFKSLQPCLAGRRGGTFSDSSSIRLGRVSLSQDAGSWEWGQPHQAHRQQQPYRELSRLPLEDENKDFVEEVLPVSIAGGLRHRHAPPPDESLTEVHQRELSVQLTRPIIPMEAWEEMTGLEFEQEDTVNQLARSGLEMCTQDENPWIEWKAHKDTEKLLQDDKGNLLTIMEEGEVLVYIGKAKQEGFGSHLPIVKTKSILPLSAQEMAELLMDSSRVTIYNKMSLGRKDVRIFNDCTKIVRNLTKPPIAKSQMVSVTLMHSRALQEQDYDLLVQGGREGYLVVSRAVPRMLEAELAELPRNDILLGANLLQDLGPDQCLMTAVTHVYSPALPTMLARKLGVSSAINFVKDIRRACEPAFAK
jgi:hypothetical protein